MKFSKRNRLLLQANLQNNINFVQFEVQPNGELLPLDLISSKTTNVTQKRKGEKARRLTGQAKAAITQSYLAKYPEQRQQVLDRLNKLTKLDPRLADQYRDSLQTILLQNHSPNDAARLAERRLGTVAQMVRGQKPDSTSRLLKDLEDEARDSKIARSVGRNLAKIDKVRTEIVKAEPTEIATTRGEIGNLKQLVKRFTEGTSFGRFIQREIKRLPTITDKALTRREFNKQAAKTLAVGSTAIAKLPQELRELGVFVFNDFAGSNEIEALVKGTQKALYDTVQGGLSILLGGQLTPEARAEIEKQLDDVGKMYGDLVDKLPDWAKRKYAEIDSYQLSRRQMLTGQWTKGKKVITLDVDSAPVVDIWDEPLPPSSRLPNRPKINSPLALPPARSLKPDEIFGRRKNIKDLLKSDLVPVTKAQGQLPKASMSQTIKSTEDLAKKVPFFRRKGVIGLGIAAVTGLTGYAGYRAYKKRGRK